MFRFGIISGPSPAIHADSNVIGFKKVNIFSAVKLAAMIAINNFRFGLRKGSHKTFNNKCCINGIGKLPSDNATGISVNYDKQIYPAGWHGGCRLYPLPKLGSVARFVRFLASMDRYGASWLRLLRLGSGNMALNVFSK